MRIGMLEVMCLILNEPIRFEPHTLMWMSTESWPECPGIFFPLYLSLLPPKIRLAWE